MVTFMVVIGFIIFLLSSHSLSFPDWFCLAGREGKGHRGGRKPLRELLLLVSQHPLFVDMIG